MNWKFHIHSSGSTAATGGTNALRTLSGSGGGATLFGGAGAAGARTGATGGGFAR